LAFVFWRLGFLRAPFAMKKSPVTVTAAGAARAARRAFSWRRLLWALVYPAQGQRIRPTLPGFFLISVALGIGMAAYNSSNNILFLTLALLLTCLILSGVLSWWNVRGVEWQIEVEPPLRVGRTHPFSLVVTNTKNVLPTYALWFDVRVSSQPKPAILKLAQRLDPRDEVRIDSTLKPARRGLETIRLTAVGSLFPFGFLRKSFATDLVSEVVVWPAPVEYRRLPVAAWQRVQIGEPVPRVGQGADLWSLRRYQSGDSHRQIHWKASARLGQLLVRQFAAESHEGFSMWVQTRAETWTRPAQFELLCSFAATLAEDLFTAGKLGAVAINDDAWIPVRRVSDLESVLDRLALVETTSGDRAPSLRRAGGARTKNVLTFAPDGALGVAAYVDGEKAAAT
jgi:uncharacterized protein (DUF58 family)